jgi:cyclic beta-1,2-glucan synthetase
VIANSTFGFQTATEGGDYTWSANSRESQLTPWSNDPVSDPPGEAFYVRDRLERLCLKPRALRAGEPATSGRAEVLCLRGHTLLA